MSGTTTTFDERMRSNLMYFPFQIYTLQRDKSRNKDDRSSIMSYMVVPHDNTDGCVGGDVGRG